MRRLTTIHPDGRIETQVVPKAELKLLQEAVGGLIETLPHFNKYEGRRCTAFVNEEGRIKGLPHNVKATELWQAILGYTQASAKNFWYVPTVQGPMVIDQKEPS